MNRHDHQRLDQEKDMKTGITETIRGLKNRLQITWCYCINIQLLGLVVTVFGVMDDRVLVRTHTLQYERPCGFNILSTSSEKPRMCICMYACVYVYVCEHVMCVYVCGYPEGLFGEFFHSGNLEVSIKWFPKFRAPNNKDKPSLHVNGLTCVCVCAWCGYSLKIQVISACTKNWGKNL